MITLSSSAIRWRPASQWTHTAIPAPWRRCLLDRGSLTERLVRQSDNHFAVEIVRQTLALPGGSEARLLGVPARQRALVREVFLLGDGQPWVFARSIMPLSTLTGRLRALRHLDARPLGALLFADPTMERGPLEIARIPGACIPGHREKPQQRLWGRRSIFRLDNKPLLVSEIFLSAYNP